MQMNGDDAIKHLPIFLFASFIRALKAAREYFLTMRPSGHGIIFMANSLLSSGRSGDGLRSLMGPTAQAEVAREASSFALPMQDFVPILPSVKKRFYGVPLPEMKRELMAKASLNWSLGPESRCISISSLLSPVAPRGDSSQGIMDSVGRDLSLPAGHGASTAAAKILLVEDIEINRILLRKLFQDLNFLLEEAENGQIAVDYFKQGKSYDLVLMDKEMPVMDGHEATRQLRSLGVKTPIIALTGNCLQSDKDMFFQAGADEFQSKVPLSRAELVRLLARYGLERPRQQ
ncbi:hypothetical protein ACLOJK_011833 [Asimina triloba]